MTDPDEIAAAVVRAFPGDEYWIDTHAATRAISDALRAYGDERAQAERERILDIALAIHADYPTDVFPSHPAAGGARLAITRLIGKVNALD